jgi:DNA invertase Pin-like site-specific DNA recombinase
MPVKCHPYTRHSTVDQEMGDSVRRQMADRERFARERGWVLTYEMHLYDRGVSARKGRHRLVGALSRFLDGIKRGSVTPGEVLMIENIDRLTREQLDDAEQLWTSILRAGVLIAVGPPWMVYDSDSLNNPITRILPLMEMYRAHQESERKSHLVGQAWCQKRKRLRADGEVYSCRRPGWLFPVGGVRCPRKGPSSLPRTADGLGLRPGNERWHIIDEHAESVLMAARWCRGGHGLRTVCDLLVQAGRRPFGRVYQGRPPRWDHHTLLGILRSRRLVGEFQPKEGPPLPDYFPALMTESEWLELQASIDTRTHARGRPAAANLVNLFGGLGRLAPSGCHMTVRGTTHGKRHDPYLVDERSRIVCRYPAAEAALLRTLTEIRPEDIFPGGRRENKSERVLKAKQKEVDATTYALERVGRQIADSPGPAELEMLMGSARELGQRRDRLLAELPRIKLEASVAEGEHLTALQSTLDLYQKATGPEREELGRRLQSDMSLIVREIWLAVHRQPGYGRKVVYYCVYLRSGVRKPGFFLSGRCWRPGQGPEDFCPGELDLRELKELPWEPAGGK